MRVISTKVITDMVLPRHWHYPQPFQNSATKIEAGSYSELLDAVQNFRLTNGLVVGDVQGDVDRYICAAFPRHCRTARQAPLSASVQVPSASKMRFIDKLVQWALQVQRNKSGFVVMSVAEDRANKCVKCSQHANWMTSGCGRCDADAQRLFLIVRQGKDVALRGKLMGCKLYDHDCRTAIWLEEKPARKENTPADCWV